jgi:F0F1-type ATP synthase assembly protein I
MLSLITVVASIISVTLPNYIFKMLVFNQQCMPATSFIKRFYYAQVLKILIIISLLSLCYLMLSVSAKLLTISFIVTYITIGVANFLRYRK